ncbi:hypothetical protein [Paraburkholderia sp. BCC1886]|uniref:hypothetical protein n=1 Tax=Paraburkholderia sp. BCC1886 TaxID=2562670 RepID=UPI001181F319|nr:hypothetical protein [Paraburkholderia sp. BCC1886]
MAIKSQESVDGLNQYVTDYYGASYVDETDPTTWKYYMNISGQYHFTDTMMTVTSLDTMEVIDFTVANLTIHTATAAAYVYGTREYLALVAMYPAQVSLILGIIYPVDITTAIDADDGTILGYPSTYVDENEYSLIAKLQNWVTGFKQRWINPQYAISDALYPTIQLANMYLGLFMAIMTFRLEACGTAEAHSYHVQQYLASHLGLDEYIPQLTLSQSMWLYRNINYLERNCGRQETFQTLIAQILTPRNVPLAAYLMKHDLSLMPTTSLVPTITFEATPLNLGYNLVPDTTWTLDTMLTNEAGEATDNATIQTLVESDIQFAMQNSKSNSLQTKVLSSQMIDESDSTPYKLEDILLHHWLWFSSQGLYTAYIVVDNPVTGDAIVPMNAKDGYVFMWYCYCQSFGIDLTDEPVPLVTAKRVQRIPTPSVSDLMSVVDTSLVTQDMAEDVLSWTPAIVPMISVTSFYAAASQIWTAANNQRGYVALQEHYVRRGMVYGMVERIYADCGIQMGDSAGQTYAEWFDSRNIDVSTFGAADYESLYKSFIEAATGLTLDSATTLANIQAAMLGIMEKLSSYSVQYLSSINTSTIEDIDWPMVRVGDVDTEAGAVIYDGNTTADVIGETVTGSVELSYDINSATNEMLGASAVTTIHHPVANTVWPVKHPTFVTSIAPIASIGVRPATPLPTNSRGLRPVLGLDLWLALTPEQQIESLVDVYSPNYNTANTPIAQITDVFPVSTLSGLVYTPPTSQ